MNKVRKLLEVLESTMENNKLQTTNHKNKEYDLLYHTMLDNASEVLQKLLDEKELDKEERKTLRLLCKAAQIIYNYSGDDTGLTDSEYDMLYEKVRELYGDEVVEVTEALVSDQKDVLHHRYKSLRGTLDKVYALTPDDRLENDSRASLDDWIRSTEQRIYQNSGKRVDLNEEDIYVFPKYDGVSCVIEIGISEVERALSRGYTTTNEAQDLTKLFKYRTDKFYRGYSYGLKTELVMSDENLQMLNEKYHTKYKQSRSMVSSIVTSGEVDERMQYVEIIPLRESMLDTDGNESLQTLSPLVFNDPYIKCKLKDREEIRKFAELHRYVRDGVRCDGAVIYLINEELQKILGRENEKQKFEVAYKFTEEKAYSTIEDMEFTTGRFGRVNPVAIFKTIKMKGNDVSRAWLGSYDRFKKLNLAPKDKVKILYDINPYLVFNDEDKKCKRSGCKPYVFPTHCSDCGEELHFSENNKIAFCSNKDCPSIIKGKLLNYLVKMNVKGISYATIDTLFSNGFLKEIPDFYKLEKHRKEIEKLEGLGEISVDDFIKELDDHRTVTYSQMLGSLGIEGVSITTFKKILEKLSYDELLELALNEDSVQNAMAILTSIKGLKDKLSMRVLSGICEMEDIINTLEEQLTLLEDEKPKVVDYTVAFTKVRDTELEEWITKNGGGVDPSLLKSTSILVVPNDKVGSKKVDAAKKWQIPIIPIDKVKEYIQKTYL